MKKFLLLMLVIFLIPITVSAKAARGGSHNYQKAKDYDCTITPKPSKVKWVSGSKRDIIGDGIIVLTWRDSHKAHDVEIKINGKIKQTGDDSRQKFTGLTNGHLYSFQVRGVSNCGKSDWSKSFRALP